MGWLEETSAISRTIATWVNRLVTSEERVIKETLGFKEIIEHIHKVMQSITLVT
jgi:Ribonuclease G/E